MSALGHEMRALVAREGPISVERFMALALGHPKYGYYMNRDPFGAAGDFTTAPEISQMFGELIGLWAAEVWGMAGRPKPAILIEFGPGRGTLMSDALRAARVAPDFRAALDVRLVETSPYLAAIQRETLLTSGAPISWCATIGEAPPGPAIILGNEFLDALPVRQFVFSRGVWRERLVDVGGDGRLAFVASDDPELGIRGAAKEGDIVEISPTAHRLVRDLAARIMGYGGAALFIDYGHVATGIGDTLQAVRAHRSVDPLADPGEADLTAHVDFASIARAARSVGAVVHGPIDQGDFLAALGLAERAEMLCRRASTAAAAEIQNAAMRLTGKAKGQMGGLFKAIAISARGMQPPGFAGKAGQ